MPKFEDEISTEIDNVTSDILRQYEDTADPEPEQPEEAEEAEESEVSEEESDLPESEEASEDTEEEDAEEEEEEAAETPELPEGMLAVDVITDKMVTEFSVKDTEGEEVEPPALMIEYKANGKMRKDRLDQVVKLAQFGVYNQEREQALLAQQESMEQEVQAVSDQLQQRDNQLRQLLEDEEAYLRVRERYLQENTPDQRVNRAEEEVRKLRTQQASERQQMQAQQFYSQSVVPALEQIATDFPEVEMDEIAAQFSTALMPSMRNGIVPPDLYPQVEQYIETVLRDWAEQKHQARRSRYDGENAKAKKEAEAAKVAAAKAKRTAATAVKPAVRSATSATKSTKPKANMSVEDAEEDALNSVLASLRT